MTEGDPITCNPPPTYGYKTGIYIREIKRGAHKGFHWVRLFVATSYPRENELDHMVEYGVMRKFRVKECWVQ